MAERGTVVICACTYDGTEQREVGRLAVEDAELFGPFAVHQCVIIADDLTLEGFTDSYTITHRETGRALLLPLTHVSAAAIARAWRNMPGSDELTTVEHWRAEERREYVAELYTMAREIIAAERARKSARALTKKSTRRKKVKPA